MRISDWSSDVCSSDLNPTDLALLLGPADVTSVIMSDSSEPELTFTIPQARMATVEGRLGLSLPIGLEGAGTVIAAGPQAKALEGRVVATLSGGMFAEFRKVSARDVIVLHDGRSGVGRAHV